MTREQAKQKLDENCKKAEELGMCVVTFFITDMITHDVYSSTGFFDNGFETVQWARNKGIELDKLVVPYLCYMGNCMYEGCEDFKFNKD